jgi:hypothetical protein
MNELFRILGAPYSIRNLRANSAWRALDVVKYCDLDLIATSGTFAGLSP